MANNVLPGGPGNRWGVPYKWPGGEMDYHARGTFDSGTVALYWCPDDPSLDPAVTGNYIAQGSSLTAAGSDRVFVGAGWLVSRLTGSSGSDSLRVYYAPSTIEQANGLKALEVAGADPANLT